MFDQESRGCQVYREMCFPLLEVDLIQRALAHDTGIIDENIELVFFFVNRLSDLLWRSEIEKISLNPVMFPFTPLRGVDLGPAVFQKACCA